MRTWLNRRIAAHGRLRAGLRLAMFGGEELAGGPHAPLLKDGSRTCACRRAVDDPVHGRAGRAALALLRTEGRPWNG
jgi:hypothetical protein